MWTLIKITKCTSSKRQSNLKKKLFSISIWLHLMKVWHDRFSTMDFRGGYKYRWEFGHVYVLYSVPSWMILFYFSFLPLHSFAHDCVCVRALMHEKESVCVCVCICPNVDEPRAKCWTMGKCWQMLGQYGERNMSNVLYTHTITANQGSLIC